MPGIASAARDKARTDTEEVTRRMIRERGRGRFGAIDVWYELKECGAGRSTVLRWAKAIIESGYNPPREAVTHKSVTEVFPPRPTTRQPSATSVAARLLPAGPSNALPVTQLLERCVKSAERCQDLAQDREGNVRNARLYLASSEHMRRTIETAARIQASIRDAAAVDRFLAAVIEEIEKESPVCAQRVMNRFEELLTSWQD